MATLVEKHGRQKRLLYIGGVSFLLGSAVLYFGFFRPPGVKDIVEPVMKKSKVLESTGLDTAILKDARLSRLRSYTRLTVEVQTGRVNPFAPYETEAIPSELEFSEEEF